MEAKDTVIQLTEIRTAYPANDVSKAQMIADQRKVSEQAEISFKAGYQACAEKMSSVLPKKFAQAKKAGIKEVVDWIEHHGGSFAEENEWEAQLKEWGIKED